MNIEKNIDIRNSTTINITHLFCPLCGGYLTYQITDKIPEHISHFCMYCKRELHVKFDYNDVRIDISYACHSTT